MNKPNKQQQRTFSTGTWNPAKWVSAKPNEFEKYNTLEDLERGAARSRLRCSLTIVCPACEARVPHGYECKSCKAKLPCVPESRTHSY